MAADPAQAARFGLTSPDRLNRFVFRHAGPAIAARAVDHLKRKWPALSAAPANRPAGARRGAVAVLLLGTAAVAPAVQTACELTLALLFFGWLCLRLVCAAQRLPALTPAPHGGDAALPVYTVLAALYREAASVDGLALRPRATRLSA